MGGSDGALPTSGAGQGLDARIFRVSALWWAATYVGSCLLNFSAEPPRDWPADAVGYAAGSVVGLPWSVVAARILRRARRRTGGASLGLGVALALLGAVACGFAAGVFAIVTQLSQKLELAFWRFSYPAGLIIIDEALYYVCPCLAWTLIYMTIVSAVQAAEIGERISRLRLITVRAQNAALRELFQPSALVESFAHLNSVLGQEGPDAAAQLVLNIAEHIRMALDSAMDQDLLDRDVAQIPPLSGSRQAGRNGQSVYAATHFASRLTIVGLGMLVLYFFLLYAATSVAVNVRSHGSSYYYVSECLCSVLVCFLIQYIARRLPSTLSLVVKMLTFVSLSIVGSYLSGLISAEVFAICNGKYFPELTDVIVVPFYTFYTYIAWLCMRYCTEAVSRETAQRALLTQTAEAAAGARNSMLRHQVRPHFLFNALNALYTLIIDARRAQAREMCDALAAYVDRSFAADERDFVPVSEQADALGAYLSIEAIRFGERLRFRAEIPDELAQAKAPTLILHPLVENAMKYAVATSADPVDVEIEARREGDELVLAVRDSGGDPEAPPNPGLGIGLNNVRARLAGHYGARGLLDCRRLTPKGFVAEIRLPLEFAWTASAA